jgi:tetratricopeptide (TPR) repeat protein
VRLLNISLHLALLEGEGDTPAVVAGVEELLRDAPGDPYAWTGAAGLVYGARAFEPAAGYARESLGLAPDNELFFWHYTETLLGLSLLLSGDTEECRRVLRTAMEEDRRRLQEGAVRAVPWDLAAAHAALGQADAAIERLEQAYENGFRHPQWLKIDPAFDGIRDDVRFRRIMERLEADLAAMRERVQEQFPHQG